MTQGPRLCICLYEINHVNTSSPPSLQGMVNRSSGPYNADNVDDAIPALSHQMMLEGYSTALIAPDVTGTNANEVAASLCNALHETLTQGSLRPNEALTETVQKLQTDLAAERQHSRRLQSKLQAREKEVGAGLARQHKQEASTSSEIQSLRRTNHELMQRVQGLALRESHYQHELRRRQVEFDRLQAHLSETVATRTTHYTGGEGNGWRPMKMGDKNASSVVAPSAGSMNHNHHRDGGSSHTGEVDMFKSVVAAYEERERERELEVRELQFKLKEALSRAAFKGATAQRTHSNIGGGRFGGGAGRVQLGGGEEKKVDEKKKRMTMMTTVADEKMTTIVVEPSRDGRHGGVGEEENCPPETEIVLGWRNEVMKSTGGAVASLMMMMPEPQLTPMPVKGRGEGLNPGTRPPYFALAEGYGRDEGVTHSYPGDAC